MKQVPSIAALTLALFISGQAFALEEKTDATPGAVGALPTAPLPEKPGPVAPSAAPSAAPAPAAEPERPKEAASDAATPPSAENSAPARASVSARPKQQPPAAATQRQGRSERAPSKRAPRKAPGARTHDGFFMRLGTGFGAYNEVVSSEDVPDSGKVEARRVGLGTVSEFSLGGTLGHGLVLGGGVFTASVLVSDSEMTRGDSLVLARILIQPVHAALR